MGRSQVVRQRILIPPFPGSNPGAPANLFSSAPFSRSRASARTCPRTPYPLNLGDETGKPLDGAHWYTLHFDKGTTPPVNAFWSIALYDSEGFRAGNVLNRFAVSSWMPFKYNTGGSLDLYFQNESPGKDKEVNWLPAPIGAFNLTMRLYSPRSEALTGKWNPPSVMRVQ